MKSYFALNPDFTSAEVEEWKLQGNYFDILFKVRHYARFCYQM